MAVQPFRHSLRFSPSESFSYRHIGPASIREEDPVIEDISTFYKSFLGAGGGTFDGIFI